jgi:hypothetical protein
MRPKAIVKLNDDDKEISAFLERVLASGPVRVQVGDETYLVKVSSEKVSRGGRDFLTKHQSQD